MSQGGCGEPKRKRARRVIFFFDYFCVVFVILSWSFCGGKRYSTITKKWYLLVVTRNEMNYNFKKLGQLFRHKSIKVPWYEPFKSIIFFSGKELLENRRFATMLSLTYLVFYTEDLVSVWVSPKELVTYWDIQGCSPLRENPSFGLPYAGPQSSNTFQPPKECTLNVGTAC